jgi:hypothetical protein
MEQEISRPKGVAREVRWPRWAPDNIKQRLTTARRFAWICFLLGSPRVLSTCYLFLTVLTDLLVVTTQHIAYKGHIRSIAQHLRAFHYGDVFVCFHFLCKRRGLCKLISQSEVLILWWIAGACFHWILEHGRVLPLRAQAEQLNDLRAFCFFFFFFF